MRTRTNEDRTTAERALAALLRLAYSGEKAAGFAYRGHWRSVADPDERARIRAIEAEELAHRARVGELLAELGVAPSRLREAWFGALGRTLGALCHVSGWLLPMFGAGRLEARNVVEYEDAARLARDAGREEWVDELLEMAEVEWDHEAYFRAKVAGHRVGRRLPLWPPPPPRETIRAAYLAETIGLREIA